MQLTDTHCHIHEANQPGGFWPEPVGAEQILNQSQRAGVTRHICIGTTAEDSQRAVDFVFDRQNCWAAVGVHPHEAASYSLAQKAIKNLVRQPKVVAVGEIGLDYFYNHSTRQQQIDALTSQLQLAADLNLPVSFHVREAFADFWPIFDSFAGIKGVLHSFTGNADDCKKALDRDLLIGINGILTFTKNDWQIEIAKKLPLDRILLETDSPFLTPRPLRGKVNIPANIMLIAEFLAEVRGDSLQNIANSTTKNAQNLFKLD